MVNSLGWIATALFTCSYLVKKDSTLRILQASASLLWISYGLLIHATPVIVANSLVAIAAIWSMLRARSAMQAGKAVVSRIEAGVEQTIS